MGFLKRLFGGGEYKDTKGIYFYAQCDNCDTIVRVRADKQYDLNPADGGYVWRKTIVDNRCFRRMQATVYLNRNYEVTQSELENGRFVSEADYQAQQEEKSN
jgi:hypothetical protein